MQEIKLSLTLDETNLILEGLGDLPFAKVHTLIAKIQQRATAQLQQNAAGSDSDGAADVVEAADDV